MDGDLTTAIERYVETCDGVSTGHSTRAQRAISDARNALERELDAYARRRLAKELRAATDSAAHSIHGDRSAFVLGYLCAAARLTDRETELLERAWAGGDPHR